MRDEQTSARASYGTVAEELKVEGATTGAMFGMPTLKTGGNAFAGYIEGAMVFKLRGSDHSAALAFPGAKLGEVGPTGRVTGRSRAAVGSCRHHRLLGWGEANGH